ncbi:hypothetical protein O9X98_10075 [Agrobacterium salinitolerans]|nr:hypothetical protein [Agrobacterium salinitolerans]
MDLLTGINKGFLAILFFIVAGVAVSNDDPSTKIILGVIAVGMVVGLIWDPASRLIEKYWKHRD